MRKKVDHCIDCRLEPDREQSRHTDIPHIEGHSHSHTAQADKDRDQTCDVLKHQVQHPSK